MVLLELVQKNNRTPISGSAEGLVSQDHSAEVTQHIATSPLLCPPPLPSSLSSFPTSILTFTELFAKVVFLATLAEKDIFSLLPIFTTRNIPVIGEGGTTFLFVFLKNPSSGLLK